MVGGLVVAAGEVGAVDAVVVVGAVGVERWYSQWQLLC